jgi:tripartite ATP-independent transporter DctM subunit
VSELGPGRTSVILTSPDDASRETALALAKVHGGRVKLVEAFRTAGITFTVYGEGATTSERAAANYRDGVDRMPLQQIRIFIAKRQNAARFAAHNREAGFDIRFQFSDIESGILSGFFTPTEIASVTVLYALLISSLFYRELTWQGILDASYETIRSSSGILLIVAVAALFGWILSVEGVPQKLTALMLQISTKPYVLLLIVNILLLVVGMFLDSTTAILVIAPIIAKPLVAAGVDPVHLGMVVVFNLMIGLLTPPMGLALFLVAEIAKVTMKDVLKEMLPYYVPLAITLLLITYFPAITTWIPRLALAR